VDKQSSPPGREILVLPQQTVRTVRLGLQWEDIKLGRDWQRPCPSKAYGWVLLTACCSNKSHPTARCATANGPCPRPQCYRANVTERRSWSENV